MGIDNKGNQDSSERLSWADDMYVWWDVDHMILSKELSIENQMDCIYNRVPL